MRIRLPHSVRLAFVLWAILLVSVSLRVVFSKPGKHSVVPIFTNAAARWLNAEDIYYPADGLDVYLYSPVLAVGFTLFDGLPHVCTEIAWRWLSAAVLLTALWRLAKATELSWNQCGVMFSLAAMLAIPSVNNGQPNVLIAGLVTLAFAGLLENRITLTAVAFAVATGLKLYPVAALLLGSVIAPRLLGKAIVTLAAIGTLPFLLQSPEFVHFEYGRLLESLTQDDRSTSYALFRAPHDWTILPRVLLGVAVPGRVMTIVSILAGAAMAWRVYRIQDIAIAFVLASVWMTLFGPATEIPTYTLLAPAAAWWCVKHPSKWAIISVCCLMAPIVRGMFPNGAFACRTLAPLGAIILVSLAMSTPAVTASIRLQSWRIVGLRPRPQVSMSPALVQNAAAVEHS